MERLGLVEGRNYIDKKYMNKKALSFGVYLTTFSNLSYEEEIEEVKEYVDYLESKDNNNKVPYVKLIGKNGNTLMFYKHLRELEFMNNPLEVFKYKGYDILKTNTTEFHILKLGKENV